MTVILPADGIGIEQFVSELTEARLETWRAAMTNELVKLHMPKFKLEYEREMNDILDALGAGTIFDPGADFSGMTEDESLYIYKAQHKTTIEVDERGTTASAASSLMFVSGLGDTNMRIDRPFVFMIRNLETDTTLFMGKIVEPIYE